jgi:hypothetical protein
VKAQGEALGMEIESSFKALKERNNRGAFHLAPSGLYVMSQNTTQGGASLCPGLSNLALSGHTQVKGRI